MKKYFRPIHEYHQEFATKLGCNAGKAMDDPIKAMKCLQSASLDEIYKQSFMFDECNILHSGFGEQGIEIRGINLFLFILTFVDF